MELRSNVRDGSPQRKHRLGEMLVKGGLISSEQLQQALKRQVQEERPLGSLLIELGYISVNDLLTFLSQQSGIPSANLFNINVPQEVIQLIPLDRIKALKILPISATKSTLTLAMVNPHDLMTISDLEFRLGRKIKPVVVPSFMIETAVKMLTSSYEDGLSGDVLEKMVLEVKGEVGKAPKLKTLLTYLVKSEASDMLLTAGVPPSLKLFNDVKRLAAVSLRPEDCEAYARQLLTENEWKVFMEQNEKDCAITFPDIGRFRINVYRQRNSVSISIRNLTEKIPSLDKLNVPNWIKEYVLKPQGMILVCGPAGHGKSTTLCAMVNLINENRRCNIITLEDPVEYLYKHKKSNINQREVGRDTETFASGLRHIFRQAPDVIVVGELRDWETFEIALFAANTGHLVLSTVHADTATSIIERVVNMFPSHQQTLTRNMLADSLLLSISQRLLPNKKKTGRVLALESLVNSYRIKNMIRESKTHQIRAQMQIGSEDFTPLDASLAELYKTGQIDYEDGLIYAVDTQVYRELCGSIKK
ncbi:MAG: PilT/PilU family type 4a pilus ATPase [Thermodesulfobacteriota bacterium]